MYKPPGGLYSEGRFNRGFFALRFRGASIWRGLFSEFYGILGKYVEHPGQVEWQKMFIMWHISFYQKRLQSTFLLSLDSQL